MRAGVSSACAAATASRAPPPRPSTTPTSRPSSSASKSDSKCVRQLARPRSLARCSRLCVRPAGRTAGHGGGRGLPGQDGAEQAGQGHAQRALLGRSGARGGQGRTAAHAQPPSHSRPRSGACAGVAHRAVGVAGRCSARAASRATTSSRKNESRRPCCCRCRCCCCCWLASFLVAPRRQRGGLQVRRGHVPASHGDQEGTRRAQGQEPHQRFRRFRRFRTNVTLVSLSSNATECDSVSLSSCPRPGPACALGPVCGCGPRRGVLRAAGAAGRPRHDHGRQQGRAAHQGALCPRLSPWPLTAPRACCVASRPSCRPNPRATSGVRRRAASCRARGR